MEKQQLNKVNYHNKYKDIVKSNNEVKSVLLHSCCAPCSTSCIERLTPNFDITILYYNPNIEPYEEYLKRKEEEQRFINEYQSINKLNMIDCDYNNDKFKELSKGLEDIPEGGARCIKCYYERLKYTAIKAKELGYDYFCTTLTLSPYKNSQILNELGDKISKEVGIPYLYSDFKKENGYKRSIELSSKYNLYRQNYCGCIYSKKESAKKRAANN